MDANLNPEQHEINLEHGEIIGQFVQDLTDEICGNIEFLAKVTLAKSFISKEILPDQNNPSYKFDAEKFEKVYEYLLKQESKTD
jgi:hypothetical protein